MNTAVLGIQRAPHPVRISRARNVENPRHGSVTGLRKQPCGGRPTAMGAELPAGEGVQEANAGS